MKGGQAKLAESMRRDQDIEMARDLNDNLFQLIAPDEMCEPCRRGDPPGRMEGEKLPDPNEPVCRVCGIRARGAN